MSDIHQMKSKLEVLIDDDWTNIQSTVFQRTNQIFIPAIVIYLHLFQLTTAWGFALVG